MADEYEIVDILTGEFSPGVEGWNVLLRRPNGKLYNHVFPKVIFEWRAAEYGLTDPDEILDLVLHEPYVSTEQTSRMVSVKESKSLGVQKKAAKPSLPTLWEATSTEEARVSHRERIDQVKSEKVKIVDPGGLLNHIKANHGMDSKSIQEKREAVDTHRWMKLYGGLPVDERKEA